LNYSITDSPPLSVIQQDSENAKEDADTDQEELCSLFQTYSEDEEYIITRGMLFFFNCEKHRHLEIECHEGNETKKLIEKEDVMP
jgi:hypothetical protein